MNIRHGLTNSIFRSVKLFGESVAVTEDKTTTKDVQNCSQYQVVLLVVVIARCSSLVNPKQTSLNGQPIATAILEALSGHHWMPELLLVPKPFICCCHLKMF